MVIVACVRKEKKTYEGFKGKGDLVGVYKPWELGRNFKDETVEILVWVQEGQDKKESSRKEQEMSCEARGKLWEKKEENSGRSLNINLWKRGSSVINSWIIN